MLDFTPKFHQAPAAVNDRSPYVTAEGRKPEAPLAYDEQVDGDIIEFLTSREPHVVEKREGIQQQFHAGIDKLADFLRHYVPTRAPSLVSQLDIFRERIDDGVCNGLDSFLSKKIRAVLGLGKLGLDSILRSIESNDIPLEIKVDEITTMVLGLVTCGDGVGVYLHMHAQNLELSATNLESGVGGLLNLARKTWNDMLRQHLIEYSERLHGRGTGYSTWDVHFFSKYLRVVGPAYGLAPIPDSTDVPEVDEAAANHCKAFLDQRMTSGALVRKLAENCLEEIHRHLRVYKDEQDRGISFTEADVFEIHKIYDKTLGGALEVQYGHIPAATIVNEYHGPLHDGETYTLIDAPVLLMRDIARNLRQLGAMAMEKFEVCLETKPGSGPQKALKRLDVDAFYIKVRTGDSDQQRYPLRVDDVLKMPGRPASAVASALENTRDRKMLSRLPASEVWPMLVDAERLDGWQPALCSPSVMRYRAASRDNEKDLLRKALSHVASMPKKQRGEALAEAIRMGDTALARNIIHNPINLSHVDRHGNSLLHLAARHGMADVIEQPRLPKDMINTGNHAGKTPFMLAAESGHVEAMKVLKTYGASRQMLDLSGRPAIALAAAKGQLASLDYLLEEGVAHDEPDNSGMTPLMHAARNGQPRAVEKLLESRRSFNLSARDTDGNDVLALAVRHAPSAVRPLLLAGARVHEVNPLSGDAALDFAAMCGSVEAIQALVEHGAKVWTCREGLEGRSPLHLAAMMGKTQAVLELIRLGAPVDTVDRLGDTPIMAAAAEGHADVIEKLFNHGARLKGIRGSTIGPLHRALAKGQGASVAMLLKLGANPQERNIATGTTALIAAAVHCPQSVGLLLDEGAPVDARGRANGTALSAAASFDRLEAVELLVKRGARLDHIGDFEVTPLGLALQYGCIRSAMYLLTAGADPFLRSNQQSLLKLAQSCSDPQMEKALLEARSRFTPRERGLRQMAIR